MGDGVTLDYIMVPLLLDEAREVERLMVRAGWEEGVPIDAPPPPGGRRRVGALNQLRQLLREIELKTYGYTQCSRCGHIDDGPEHKE